MYVISNQQVEEIKQFLEAFRSIPPRDNRVYNLQRRAGLTLKKLDKAKRISQQQLKSISNENND